MAPTRQKRNVARRRRLPIYRQLRPTQGDAAAYSGQQITVLDVPGDTRLAASGGTGILSNVFAINALNISSSFHTFFNSVFQEYRIRRVKFEFMPVLPAIQGATLMRFDEKDSNVPIWTEMMHSASRLCCHNQANPKSCFTMTWIARDIGDLVFEQITTDPTSAYLRMYTDNTNLLAPNAATDLFVFRPTATIEFRGLGPQ
jgi:hypothetical protein